MSVPNPAKTLKLDEPPLAGRTRFVSEADRSIIQLIRFGLLFVMAFWSITSFKSLARLREVLALLDPDGLLEVVIVDTDGCPDLYDCPEFAGSLTGGYGQLAWVKYGRIVKTSGVGHHPECFEPYTREFLEGFASA